MAKHIRVRGLRRVSGDQQDSEMQLREMEKFCERRSTENEIWELEYVYNEDDVSAFKNLIEDREVMNEIIQDAEQKKFDVFLAYKFDRIGRKGINTQNWIYKMNEICRIPVWTTDEGYLGTETMVDQIKLSIYAGKAQQESMDTSKRTDDKHKLMVEKCIYRGGTPPYGYKLIRSGEFGNAVYNKKGKELVVKVINEDEAAIIKMMFDLVYYNGYGSNRIAKELNTSTESRDSIPNRSGGKWSAGVIRYILRNPIYKGLYTYGKTKGVLGKKERHRQPKENWTVSNDVNPLWVIIEEEIFDKVQEIMDAKMVIYNHPKANNDGAKITIPSKGKLLFGGFAYCGHCKSSMSITTNKRAGKTRAFYRCAGKTHNRVECDGQVTYAKERIENSVLMQIFEYIETLREIDYSSEIMKYNQEKSQKFEREVKKARLQVEEIEDELVALNREIGKVLINKSNFTQESLSQAIDAKSKELDAVKKELERADEALLKCTLSIDDLQTLRDTIPRWQQEFARAPFDRKKMLLAMLIERVEIYRDHVDIQIKVNLQEMLNNWLCNTQKREHDTAYLTTLGCFEKTIEIDNNKKGP